MFSEKPGSEDSEAKKGGHGEQVDKPIFLMTVQSLLSGFVGVFFFLFNFF